MEKLSKYEGVNKLNDIIQTLMIMEDYPNWDFINNVLTCKERFGTTKLWLHWGKMLLHRPQDEGKNAIDHQELDKWEIDTDGYFTFIGKEWSD